MVQHFCTCDKNSSFLVMPRYERVFSPVENSLSSSWWGLWTHHYGWWAESVACLPRGGYRLLRKQKSRQLQGSCGRTSVLISETGVQHVLENPLSEFTPGLLSGECGSVSDEQGERFHQDFAAVEGRYKGKWSPSVIVDYCWTLIRDSPNSTFSRQAKKARLH